MQEGDDWNIESAYYVIEEIDYTIATQYKDGFGQFTRTARNCAVLDTCCTSPVSGRSWLDIHVQQLCEKEQKRVTGPDYSERLFKFGNYGMPRSLGKFSMPAVTA